MSKTLEIKIVHPGAKVPTYAHIDDSGMDLYATNSVTILKGHSALIKTGIKIKLPRGTEAQIRPKSGLALKYGITVLNTPGTVDEGYRGEVGVILINHGARAFAIEPGMKIAQMVICPVIRVSTMEIDALDKTTRDQGGFGSTGA